MISIVFRFVLQLINNQISGNSSPADNESQRKVSIKLRFHSDILLSENY